MKKILAVALSVLLLLSCCALGASAAGNAAAGTTGEFTVFCQNVAGLPDISFITGEEARDVVGNQLAIAAYVEANEYDIFAVQEDFSYHADLAGALPSYTYQTLHHGGVPVGDGTNIYTRDFPMYNEKHIPWNTLYGLINDGADEFSQKGITYCCIEVADGVLIDFYNVHADAYDGEGSRAARLDNYNQLRDLINARTVDRPVIITGDFNEYFFGGYHNLREIFCNDMGMKDSWIELYNGGNYNDCSAFEKEMNSQGIARWGNWDSVERFIYKDGGGISLECDSFEYVKINNASGVACSDHSGCAGSFTFTVNTATDTSSDKLNEGSGSSALEELIRRIVDFFKALMLVFGNFDQIFADLKGYLN